MHTFVAHPLELSASEPSKLEGCWLELCRCNEVEDTTAAVVMVYKYGGKDTPGIMAGVSLPPYLSIFADVVELGVRSSIRS